jgi:hypothetical protein
MPCLKSGEPSSACLVIFLLRKVGLLRIAGDILRVGENTVFILEAAACVREDEFVGESIEFNRV